MTPLQHAAAVWAGIVLVPGALAAGCGSSVSSQNPVAGPAAGVKYEPPRRKKAVTPVYPAALKKQGIEADVSVRITIDETGKVTAVKVVRGSPHPDFNESARQSAFAEEFTPATRDGVPIPFLVSFTYRFRLEEE